MRLPVALALGAMLLAACGSGATAPSPAPTPVPTLRVASAPPPTSPPPGVCAVKDSAAPASKAVIELANGGTITIALRADKAPGTVRNFANVARSGCYDGLLFHRVEPGFVIQGGDPEGTGRGGGTMKAEYNDLPFLKGALGIARGNDKAINNDRQFFICIAACRQLDNNYTNFGLVTDGQALADAVKIGDKIKTIRIE